MENDSHERPLFWKEERSKLVTEVQELGERLEKEKDNRKEERFIWLLVSVTLLNVFIFQNMESFLGPLIIGVFEAVALIVLAKILGLEEIVRLIDRLMVTASGSKGSG